MARKKTSASGSKKRPRKKKAGKRAGKKVAKGSGAPPVEENAEARETPIHPDADEGRDEGPGAEPAATDGSRAESPGSDTSASDLVDPGAPTTPQAPDVYGATTSDDEAIIDLDAEDSEDDVDRWIAETVAMAPAEEGAAEREEPPIDLDARTMAESHAPTAEKDAAPAETPPPEGAAEAPPEQASEALQRSIDLGPVSSPEVRDRLLAEALAHAEHQDARYRVPFPETANARRWKALAVFALLLTAGTVAVAPPEWARPETPVQLGSGERARNLRAALLLQAQQVEAFRVRTQRLPATLAEVAETLPGVRYVQSGNRAYQLIVHDPAGNAIVYDSADPTPAFEEIATVWTTPEVVP